MLSMFSFKTYVQHVMKQNGSKIYKQICKTGGYFYICGDITMAEDVQNTLEGIIREHGGMTGPRG